MPLPDASPALVTPELAQVAQERLAYNKEAAIRNNKHAEIHLLRAGFIKCGICGHNMVAIVKSDGRPIYVCQFAQKLPRDSLHRQVEHFGQEDRR